MEELRLPLYHPESEKHEKEKAEEKEQEYRVITVPISPEEEEPSNVFEI